MFTVFKKSLLQRHIEPTVRGTESAVFAKCIRYLCVLFLVASFLFLGCGEETKVENPSLHGRWESTFYEVWIINLFNKTLESPSVYDMEYSGNILEIDFFNNNGTAGIIFINLTETGSLLATSGIGTITGVHFVNLTDTTVEISLASNASYKTPVFPTVALAKQTLNVDSVLTYFAMTSACVRQ